MRIQPKPHLAIVQTEAPAPEGPLRFWDKATAVALVCPEHRASIDVWHASEPGFGVRIGKPRKRDNFIARSYLARYKDAQGKECRPVLGRFEELTYEEARRKATRLRDEAAEVRRQGRPTVPTLRDAFTEYAKRKTLAEASSDDYLKRLRYLTGWPADPAKYQALKPSDRLPSWADRKLSEIAPHEWETRYATLERTCGEATAKGVARLARAVYKDLLARRVLDEDATTGLARNAIYSRGGHAGRPVPREKLPALWQWMHTSAHPTVRDYMLVGFMTGLRESVIGALRWEQVSMEKRALLVPAEARGNKRKVMVWMPLADELFERVLLPRYAVRGSSPWVLPSTKPKKPKDGTAPIPQPLRSINGSFKALAQATGIRISDHDLRRTFSTLGRQVLRDTLLIARMLTHLSSSMTADAPAHTGGYIFIEDSEMRNAFNAVADAFVWLATHEPNATPPTELLADWAAVSMRM